MAQALSGCAVRAVIQQEAAAKLSDDRHYLGAIKHRLKMLYELSEDNPRTREQLSDEIDWVNEKLGIDEQ